ncbi:hypothetical protein V1520DRAFT_340866 [Lipomyces starkeyi]|uniref:Shugoshin C-terminal domain-containing protein n=1 Tax=Lipomyces starkeyi NRRL Y-11557 TaxID=675824 RepID=A0A1E3Q5B1_LIPST|nr:hypothetical protein LIPSTDRAFT_72437 [Lipomyces starkeyi NRRL Y-11557]
MAKLVEHVSTETVDSVKRRFLRQNRELARVNSSHSTRIGNLESKIASLISENLELRQQIISLEHSREQWITRKCSEVRVKIQRKVKEIDELLDAFEMSAKDAIYASPEGESDGSGRRDSLDSVVGVPASAIHVSTRRKSPPGPDTSPPVYPDLDDGGDEVAQGDDLICDNCPRSPQPKEPHRFMPEELSAEEIPESPSELADAMQLMNIVSGTETVRPRRKRRDSLQEMDIVSMVKSQNANYKAKLSQCASAPVVAAEHMSNVVEPSMVIDDGNMRIALSENIPPPPEPIGVAIAEAKRSEAKTTATKRRSSISANDTASDTSDRSTQSAPSSRPSSRRSSVYRESLLETETAHEARKSSPPPAARRSSRRSSIYREPARDTLVRPNSPTDEARMKLGENDKNVVVSKDNKAAEKASISERKVLQPLNVNLEADANTAAVKKSIKSPTVRDIEVKPADPERSEAMEERPVSTTPEGGRRVGRARKSVNYALPSLRVKMRRERDQFIDAVAMAEQIASKFEAQKSSELKQSPTAEAMIKQENTDDVKAVDFSNIPEMSPAAAGIEGVKGKKRKSTVTNLQDAIKREPTDDETVKDSRSHKANAVTKTRRPASVEIPRMMQADVFDFAADDVHTNTARRNSGIPTSTSRIGIAQAVESGARRPNRQVGANENDASKTTTAGKRRLSMVA